MTDEPQYLTQVSSREVYRNNWMALREDVIRRPDGSEGIYAFVEKTDYAVVIATDGERFALVEQFRYPVRARTWEFPMGTLPTGIDIDPADLARQELREETGVIAGSMMFLGHLHLAPGASTQLGSVYYATDLQEGQPDREHEEQDMRSAWFTRAELERMIRTGEMTDAQSLASYAHFLLYERLLN